MSLEVVTFESCCVDITQEVTPTIRYWRDNTINTPKVIFETVSEADLHSFLTSCDLLKKFYTDGDWEYGVISARKVSSYSQTQTIIQIYFD